ncbi:MAG TPA: hypothetical protein VGC13_09515 [Longimicrobium sp.]|uniref:hypothetical protein n=1 Tax=Longimicrobium sp. TaxID=2029185 RepID=UPI002ED9B7B4
MQAKLKLNLEDLTVESFNTTTAEKPKGTVFGEQCTCYTNCTCPGCPTCDNTCAYTCDDATCPACPTCAASCNGTCQNCGTDAYSCYDTNCCPINETCQQTNCGMELCCGI